MESASASHIYSFYGESLNGISTIRAFGAEDRFLKQMQTYIDNNLKIYYSNVSANRWLGLRLEITGSLIIVFVSFLTVLNKNNISSGQAGLSISYALSITQILMWMVRTISDFETNIISITLSLHDGTEMEICWSCYANLPFSVHGYGMENPVAKSLWGRTPLVGGYFLLNYKAKSEASKMMKALKYLKNF